MSATLHSVQVKYAARIKKYLGDIQAQLQKKGFNCSEPKELVDELDIVYSLAVRPRDQAVVGKIFVDFVIVDAIADKRGDIERFNFEVQITASDQRTRESKLAGVAPPVPVFAGENAGIWLATNKPRAIKSRFNLLEKASTRKNIVDIVADEIEKLEVANHVLEVKEDQLRRMKKKAAPAKRQIA